VGVSVIIAIFCLTGLARAQVPFFNAGATAYSAQVSTISGGADTTTITPNFNTTLSADHKYVTMGAQAINSGLPVIQSFNLTSPTGGTFVGTPAAPATPAATATGGATAPGASASSTAVMSVLDKPGMTLVAPLRE
jgi:hypothetical protein